MKLLIGLSCAVWVTFCALLLHWIGLLGEGFGYAASDLKYLKFGVLLWLMHAVYSGFYRLGRNIRYQPQAQWVWIVLTIAVLFFDLALLLGGRPENQLFIALPAAHGIITVGLWQVHRLRS